MEIKVNLQKDFDLEKISKKLTQLAQASLGIWAKSYIKQTHIDIRNKNLFTPRTGTLLKSIQAIPQGSTVKIAVFTRYGKFLEEGTKSYVIKPKDRKALKIPNPSGTGYIFRKKVKHPGIEPRGWFIGAFEERSEIANNAMVAYFKRGLEKIQKGEI